jgi:hypothetical protein
MVQALPPEVWFFYTDCFGYAHFEAPYDRSQVFGLWAKRIVSFRWFTFILSWCSVWFVDNDNSVNMIWHDDEFTQFDKRKMCWNFKPTLMGMLSCFR